MTNLNALFFFLGFTSGLLTMFFGLIVAAAFLGIQ